jgi:hypothetical protein
MYPCRAILSQGHTRTYLSAPEMVPLSDYSCGPSSASGFCCGTYCAVRTSVCVCLCVERLEGTGSMSGPLGQGGGVFGL